MLGFLSALVCSVAAGQTGPATAGEELDGHAYGCGQARAAALQPVAGDGWSGGGTAEDADDTDVLHYHLDLEIDAASGWLGGSNTMTVRSLVDGLTTFRFRLDTTFTISDLRVNDLPASWTRPAFPTVEVALDRAYDTGEEFVVFVAYDGHPVSHGWGSIVLGAGRSYTLSQPWWAYTWWPAKDDNVDKTTADLWFTVPDKDVVASNGVLMGVDTLAGGQKRYRWATSYPTVTYLYCFAVDDDYQVTAGLFDYDGGSMPVELYWTSDVSSRVPALIEMLTIYSELFGLYPFVEEKYGICRIGFGGGMEHQTMTGQGMLNYEWLTAHELSHQWWGDMLTCATWHDIWLNEGFATYSEALWAEHRAGSSGAADLHAYMHNRRPSNASGTVYCYDISDMNRIFNYDLSYQKGGWVLHMLRHVVGDEAFNNILAAYRAAFEYGSATTEDFRAIAETVTGRDLAWFFAEWVYQGGAPAYEWAWRPHALAGKHYVELFVRQTQSGAWPTFAMPVEIVAGAGGEQVVYTVWNDARAEHLLFETGAAVQALAFDPNHWILSYPEVATPVEFVEGPPKIVASTPVPGGTVAPHAGQTIRVVFHKDAVVEPGQFTLTGDAGGVVPLLFAYDAGAHIATLTAVDALPVDDYTLAIGDEVVDVAAGLALDGEVADPTSPAALPSGDGLPGGDALVRFSVVPGDGDLNCDGVVGEPDVWPFVLALIDPAAYAAAYPTCDRSHADLNGDGRVNAGDIPAFVALLTQ